MNEAFGLDKLIRVPHSALYRLILIISCILTVSSFEVIHFKSIYYYLFLVSYIILIIPFQLTKLRKYAPVRPILDQLLITLVLYKNINHSLLTSLLLVLPIINSPNFSGNRMSFIYLAGLILLSLSISSARLPTIQEICIVFLAISIKVLEHIRAKIQRIVTSFHQEMSEVYLTKNEFNRPENIYSLFIDKLNDSKLKILGKVGAIYCLKINPRKKKYQILSGSQYGEHVTIPENSSFVKNFVQEKVFSQSGIIIDKHIIDISLVVSVKFNRNDFRVYILEFYPNKSIFNQIPIIRDIVLLRALKPSFTQFGKYLQVENDIINEKSLRLHVIKSEYDYVLRTISAVHFVRNKLSPIKNFLEISEDMMKDENNQLEVDKNLVEIIASEQAKAASTLREILERTAKILDNKDNPFNVAELKEVKIDFICNKIDRTINSFFLDVKIEKSLISEHLNELVSTNTRGLDILFADIINNMRKYNNGERKVAFAAGSTTFNISFTNSFNEKQMSDCIEAKNFLNSSENYHIFKMQSKGLFLIKDFCKQMNISYDCVVNTRDFTFSINLQLPRCNS